MENYTPIIIWVIVIGLIIILVSSIWHELYKLSGYDPIIGLIAPVNESVWEHSKLLIFPILLIFLLIWGLFRQKLHNPFIALLLATLAAIFAMIIIHFIIEVFFTPATITDVIMGHVINYALALFIGLFVFMWFLISRPYGQNKNVMALVLYIILLGLTFWWTYHPPSPAGIWHSPKVELPYGTWYGTSG